VTRPLVPLHQRAASAAAVLERRVKTLENRIITLAGLLVPGTWYPISLDAGWSPVSGYAAPSWATDTQGQFLYLTGLANFGSSQTVDHNLNSGTPLPEAACPQTMKLFRAWDGQSARATVQISPSGVIEALGNSTYPYQYAELDAVLTLSL
jgi:hypothetical protein